MQSINRRSLLMTGTFGLTALAVPGFAKSASIATARGFTHAVASGEPAADSMLLWTRYVPTNGDAVELRVEVAETPDFAKIVSGGAQITGPWRDHTAKITVGGLAPGRSYYFRFVAPDGTFSPTGRTKTLPEGIPASYRIATFSCSNMPFGYFNAYGHAVARGDVDLAIHLGDYLYEYEAGTYPAAAEVVAGRPLEPSTELLHLADYRLRYASYRADPDLQKLHASVPMIVQWDDHESANDSWEGGAENHQAAEGDWGIRRAAAIQAYREWMPVSDEPWKAYDIGTLATLFRTETRLLARTRQPDIADLFKQADPAKALVAFRDGAWMDPAATMMGSQQEDWLAHAMRGSVARGTHWQVVGFGTILGSTVMPAQAADWIDPDAKDSSKGYILAGIAAAQAGLPFNYDSWGGYPAARSRFLKSAQAMGANLVVLTGDSHNAWSYDLAQDGKPAGVEFAGHSVTSPGYEHSVRTDPKRVAAGLVAANPELKWCDTSRRGYMATTITPDRISNDWVMMDTIKTASRKAMIGHTAVLQHGRNAAG
ncbi:alkaline phosphatase D family protein [Sphingomonas immobilis]|uniref:Alkaline phosphatase D family protein n=1 Tax=Sphingomonas immobilis TaxID=3063997 RepID=A0ABT8ZYL0_9SPHN|nr:alkaline phosphatase D family protein [Sphingomonas sp. CA1-15]MDO7842670.1 alkaline phosphatase D family protein [Sphingomonas sp. CA1-15]